MMLTAREMAAALQSPWRDEEVEDDCADIMVTLLGNLRALHWFHWTAHWQSAGSSSYGDHLMFERLKDAVYAEIDPLAEKVVGYYGAGKVDPHHVMHHEHGFMAPEGSSDDLVGQALHMERNFQLYLSHVYDTLKDLEMLPLGLDDFLAAVANTHDAHVYLLQQRLGGAMARTAVLNQRGMDALMAWVESHKQQREQHLAVMNSLEKSWLGESTFAPMRHAEEDEDLDDLELAWMGR